MRHRPMNQAIQILEQKQYPTALREIPSPPEELYLQGAPIDAKKKVVTVVGSRKHSAYAEKACRKIITELTGLPIIIVSGLAIGIDTIAHKAALRAGLTTIAVVGSGLDTSVLYPARNKMLAKKILEKNGTLLSELKPKERAAKHTFPSRNRIMAGLADLVIAIECGMRSGTRITARLAIEYNRELGAVPHSIFSSAGGSNELLKMGAHVIQSGGDVAEIVGLV